MHAFDILGLRAVLGEFEKRSAVPLEELERSVRRLEKLESDPPEPKQLGRYAMLGATLAPITSVLGDKLEGNDWIQRDAAGQRSAARTVRRLGAKGVAGAITTGVIPVLRHHMDRQAEIHELKSQLARLAPAPSTPLPEKVATALVPSGHSPARILASSRRIGEAKITAPGGPSIAQTARTFGRPIPGATK